MNEKEPTQPTQPERGEPVQIPVPKRSAWDKLLGKVAKPKDAEADSAPE